TAARPADLQPTLSVQGNLISIQPTLINPGDGMFIQIICVGEPRDVTLSGRVENLKFARLDGLPYPPGGGREGEGSAMDQCMWVGFTQRLIVLLAIVVASLPHDISIQLRVAIGVVAGAVMEALYLLRVRFLVNRRALWRP